MVRIYKKVKTGLELLTFFTTRQWIFENKNYLGLWKAMGGEDRKRFLQDFDVAEPEEYVTRIVLGARQYCMKEPLTSIPKCRIQHFL